MLHTMLSGDVFIQLHVRFKPSATITALIICSVKMFDLNVVGSCVSGCTFLIAEGADELASNRIDSHQFLNFGIVFGKAL